jgi:lipopolysaccharide biosynthesis protein
MHTSNNSLKARLIAFYLPQFHPIPENDEWWGKGFTEWTNVAKARPLFRGHHQPNVPADLGFYDLRLPEARVAQAALARTSGIEGFCYWHYWFAGKRLLERPFNEVLRSGQPDFPFCLGWANQTWTGIWHGAPNRVLIEQTYPGRADNENHFHALLEAFHDPRYIRVRGKPVFVIYRPTELPRPAEFVELWQTLAIKNGLAGIHFVAHVMSFDRFDYLANGFAGVIPANAFRASNMTSWRRSVRWHQSRNGYASGSRSVFLLAQVFAKAVYLKGKKHLQPLLSRPQVIDYQEAMLYFLDNVSSETQAYPCVVPNWDNSPRSGIRAVVLQNSTPGLFREHLREALRLVADRAFEDRIVFLKSWNEWAEGNYLEPDLRFGHQYLDTVREEVFNADHEVSHRYAHGTAGRPTA